MKNSYLHAAGEEGDGIFFESFCPQYYICSAFLFDCAAIQSVLSSKKDVSQGILSGKTDCGSNNGSGLRGKLNKVVLAYSGGLDTSVIVPWLRYILVHWMSQDSFIDFESI